MTDDALKYRDDLKKIALELKKGDKTKFDKLQKWQQNLIRYWIREKIV